jgi:hypothetical protein
MFSIPLLTRETDVKKNTAGKRRRLVPFDTVTGPGASGTLRPYVGKRNFNEKPDKLSLTFFA